MTIYRFIKLNYVSSSLQREALFWSLAFYVQDKTLYYRGIRCSNLTQMFWLDDIHCSNQGYLTKTKVMHTVKYEIIVQANLGLIFGIYTFDNVHAVFSHVTFI